MSAKTWFLVYLMFFVGAVCSVHIKFLPFSEVPVQLSWSVVFDAKKCLFCLIFPSHSSCVVNDGRDIATDAGKK